MFDKLKKLYRKIFPKPTYLTIIVTGTGVTTVSCRPPKLNKKKKPL